MRNNSSITKEEKLRILNADFAIRIGSEIFKGARVKGAKLEFPFITFNHGGLSVNKEVAWSTLLRCLDENRPVSLV